MSIYLWYSNKIRSASVSMCKHLNLFENRLVSFHVSMTCLLLLLILQIAKSCCEMVQTLMMQNFQFLWQKSFSSHPNKLYHPLSLSLSLAFFSFYLSHTLSIALSFYFSFFLSLSIYLSLSFNLPLSLCIYLSHTLSIYLSLSICLSLSTYLVLCNSLSLLFSGSVSHTYEGRYSNLSTNLHRFSIKSHLARVGR